MRGPTQSEVGSSFLCLARCSACLALLYSCARALFVPLHFSQEAWVDVAEAESSTEEADKERGEEGVCQASSTPDAEPGGDLSERVVAKIHTAKESER